MVKRIEAVLIWAVIGIVALVILLTGCANKKVKSHVQQTPGSCIVVSGFGQTCKPNAQGYLCNQVQLKVKPVPECNEFNAANVLDLRKTK